MLFINGSDSVQIEEWVKVLKLHTRGVFTIQEASVYLCGFASIGYGDNVAIFGYKAMLNLFYDAYKSKNLELCELEIFPDQSMSSVPRVGVNYIFTLSGVEYEFLQCKISREFLIKFACIVKRYPLFLFPDDDPEEINPKVVITKSGKREEDKLITEKEWDSVIEDANDVIANTSKSYHFNSDNYNCSNIGKKLFIDQYPSVVKRKEASVIRKLRDCRHRLRSKRKDTK